MRAAADREDRTEEHIMMPGRVIPVREMLGELLLDLGEPGTGIDRFRSSPCRPIPNRFRSLYGAARCGRTGGRSGQGGEVLLATP